MSTVPSTVLMKTLTQVHIIPLRSVLSSSQTFRSAPISELPIEPPTTADWNSQVRVASLSPPHGHWCEGLGPSQAHQNCAAPGPLLGSFKAFHKRRCARSSNKLPHRPPSPSWPPSTATGWAVADATSVSKLKASGTGEWRRAKARESNEHRASIGKKCNKVNKLLPAGIQNGFAAETFTSYKFRNMQFLTSKSLGAPKASTFEHLHPNQTYHVTQKKDLNLTEKATSNLESSPGHRCCYFLKREKNEPWSDLSPSNESHFAEKLIKKEQFRSWFRMKQLSIWFGMDKKISSVS